MSQVIEELKERLKQAREEDDYLREAIDATARKIKEFEGVKDRQLSDLDDVMDLIDALECAIEALEKAGKDKPPPGVSLVKKKAKTGGRKKWPKVSKKKVGRTK